jgi:hypothetical protein
LQLLDPDKMKTFLIASGLLCYSISFAQLPAYIPANGLVAFYPFSGNANDSSGHGHHGTAVGATLTNDRFGNPNRAFNLNSVGSKIDLLSGNFWLANDRTISFWFLSNPSGTEQRVLGYRPTCMSIGEQGFEFLLNAQNPIMEYWNAHSNGNQNAGPFVSGAWTHVLFSKEDTIGKYYVNGILQMEIHPIETIGQNAMLAISSGISCIANFPNSSAKRFKGSIDEIGIWNRSLSASEISNVYLSTTTETAKELESRIEFFPNPAMNQIKIRIQDNLIGAKYSIFDISGKEKIQGILNEVETTEFLNLKPGIYMLDIAGKVRHKFILN